MKKVTEVTPARRGRPPKKQLVTPNSAPAAAGETGAAMSDVCTQTETSSTNKRHQSSNLKKINESRSASVGSINKRGRKKADATASSSSKRSTSSSRTSSKEKVESLLSKTVKQEALKVVQGLESPSTIISGRAKLKGRTKVVQGLESASTIIPGRAKLQGGHKITQRSRSKPRKICIKKSARSKFIKELGNDTPEIKRLLTSDGFWSSKASSRSSSPLETPSQSQKQAHAAKKDSRTSTPNISPSSSKRQSFTKMQTEKDDMTTPKLNIPVSELRRLRTTDGFSFPDTASGASKTVSRDVSPSSCSSLDRGTRQNSKSLSRSNDNKLGLKTNDIDQVMGIDDVPGKAKMKAKKEPDDVSDKLSEQKTEMSETAPVSSSLTYSLEPTGFESPVSRFGKKKKDLINHPKNVAKQEKFSSQVGKKKTSSFVRGFNKRHRLQINSELPQPETQESNMDITISTSTDIQPVKKKARSKRHSGAEKAAEKSPLKKRRKVGAKKIQETFPNVGSCVSRKASPDLCTEDINVPELSEAMSLTDSVSSVKSSSSPEFAISDLLASAELKRLNTTAGFWASTPDIGTVLSKSHARRLRDADSSSARGSDDNLKLKQVRQTKRLANFQKTSAKPQSTLLQHRKKRLHALQSSLRKIKQLISNDELADQCQSVDSISSPQLTEAVTQPKPKYKSSSLSVRKRPGKSLSKVQESNEVKNVEELQTPIESVGIEVNVREPLVSEGSGGDTTETAGSPKSKIDTNIHHELSGPEMESSVTDTPPPKLLNVKAFKGGRRKLISGDVKATVSVSSSGIKTRGRGKVDTTVKKSLEHFKNLKPIKEEKLTSVSIGTSKVRSDKIKLKRERKELLKKSSSEVHISDGETDKYPQVTEATQIKDLESNEKDQESTIKNTITDMDNVDDEKNSILMNTNAGLKKDNLFESIGIDLFKPSGMSELPCMKISSVEDSSSVNESVVESQIVKCDPRTLVDTSDHGKHEVVCKLETTASSTSVPDFNKDCINSDESGPEQAKTELTVVGVSEELLKDIPDQTDSKVDDSHSCADSLAVLEKLQACSLNENLAVGSIELNSEGFNALNDTSVDVSEDVKTLIQKDEVHLETRVILQSEIASLGDSNGVSFLVPLVEKEICTTGASESECNISDKRNEMSSTSNVKEHISESGDCKSNNHLSIENQIREDTGSDVLTDYTPLHVDIMATNIETGSTGDFISQNFLSSQDIVSDNNGQTLNKPIVETVNLSHENQHAAVKNRSEIYTDETSNMVSVCNDHDVSKDNVLENVVGDAAEDVTHVSRDDGVSVLDTLQPTTVHVSHNTQKKRKKQTDRLFRRKLDTKPTVLSYSSDLVLDIPVPTDILETCDGITETNVSNELLADSRPNIEPLKRAKKRRRNAWKRGVLKKSPHVSRKAPRQAWSTTPAASEKSETSIPSVISHTDDATTALDGLQDENNEGKIVETYPPTVKKSLTNMLKKLQTNANLANAVLDENSFKGRLLRNIYPKEQKEKKLKIRRKNFVANFNAQDNTNCLTLPVEKIESLQIEIPGDPVPVKRKRGRPKKQTYESIPKLIPLQMLPVLRPATPWNKTPPHLSPQTLTAPNTSSMFLGTDELNNTQKTEFMSGDDTNVLKNLQDTEFVCAVGDELKNLQDTEFVCAVGDDTDELKNLQDTEFVCAVGDDTDELKNLQDTEFVSESVDDTDLHLYLSGVSDEEQSPKKDSLKASDAYSHDAIPIYQDTVNDNSCIQETLNDMQLNTLITSIDEHSVVVSIKEPKKPGRPKMKGRKGCPPGIPMTEEERRKKAQKTMLSQVVYKTQDLLDPITIAQNSIQTPDVFTVPDFTGEAIIPAAKFSLRKKSTRSPLEMLAMKRKQEEAMYDLEQEKRQARIIHLREMRSARESNDGFSDDGDGGQSPESLMLCSVVLSDFVKKLQLNNIDLSSGEEGSHQVSDLIAGRESPEYNTFEDDNDEDWCADLEEHGSEERNDSRPYIPRLKLKRVIKKGPSTQNKKIKLTTLPPNERQHEPIKLVIKAEPTTESHENVAAKCSSFDLSKGDRSGFESSYVDFLRGKSDPAPDKIHFPRRMYKTPRINQPETDMQNVVSDMSSVEILSLPTLGVRDVSLTVDESLLTETGKSAMVMESHPASSSTILVTSTQHLSHVHSTMTSADGMPNVELTERTKRLSSVDEEDDDILILDLDDGVVDQNSEDIFKEGPPTSVGSASLHVQTLSDINITAKGIECVSQENTHFPGREDILGDNGMLRSTQRSHSNDEMGLMLESYNSQKDQEVEKQSHLDINTDVSFVSTEKLSSCTGNVKINHIGKAPQTVNIVQEVHSILVPVSNDNTKVIHQPHKIAVGVVGSLLSSETDKIDTSEVVDVRNSSSALNIENKRTVDVEDHKDGKTSTQGVLHDEEEAMSRKKMMAEQIVIDKVSVASDITVKETSQSELLTTASDKTLGDCAPDAANLDNNNVTLSFKSSPKVSAPVKKPGFPNENSKSPKHSTYHGSGPEEWKVKVILHSDKFPSGKYSCKRCGFTTSAKLPIESHIYSHIPGVQFRCAYCESEFSSMAATSSHLKNTHSLSEAKLHISRHIDEKNFYDKEDAPFSEENGQQSPAQAASTNTGGQSPPVIISVVVSGGVGGNRGGRPSAPPRRFVCTHCGFSTNVKEDAEHHALDLHASQALFACLLCSENVCYTESEIKDHCATVHPARHHPYRKLPDFYDAEQLNLKDKTAAQDDRENIFERMTSMFQDEAQTSTTTIDHRQKAKEYLYLQEGWREKTRVEADSTTAVDLDYTEEHDNAEEQSAPQTPTQEQCLDESSHHTDAAENEASDHTRSSSQAADVPKGDADLSETPTLMTDDAFITSSAASATRISSINSQVLDSGRSREVQNQHTVEGQEEMMSQTEEPACHSAEEAAYDDHNQDSCHLHPHHSIDEDNDDDDGGMGLKIVQVVSLSGQEDIVDEQISMDQSQAEQVDTDIPAEKSGDNSQAVSVLPGSSGTFTNDAASELLTPKHSSASNKETVMQKELKAQNPVDQLKPSMPVTATDSPTADGSATSSSTASPSFAGGLPLSYKCNACKVHTPYLLMMVKHLKAKHPNMRCFSCPYCKTTHSFVSQKQLRHHVKQSHPSKFGRNEIALSEDAKKFVEAMVLPMGPECIRVGNRIVLEEDIHTCTYCQVKMISLANVYEHLNTKHSDLFEFVCPVCQSFKSKILLEISDHCLKTHKSSLDPDKVHVSVPKNLFTALTCISKNGKYIEKNLAAGAEPSHIEKASTSSTSAVTEPSEKGQATSVQGQMSHVSVVPVRSHISAAAQSQVRSTSIASTPKVPASVALVSAATQPNFVIPLMSSGVGAVTSARTVVAFSSSLFDTSSLTATPQVVTASQSIPIIHNAAASSFLSPLPQQAHVSNQHIQSNKQQQHPPLQLHPRPTERANVAAKNLPVLIVPTIKPRSSTMTTKSLLGSRRSDDHIPADTMPKNVLSTSSSIASLLTSPATNQQTIRPTGCSPSNNLPDDEPNPDAFKIFNLRPTGPMSSPSSASPTISPVVPSVFPPVSVPMTSGYIQGTIAGFPPGMIISPNLLPLSFPFSQHPPLVQGMLTQKQSPRNSPLSRHLQLSHPSSAQPSTTVRSSISHQEAMAATYMKKQQQQRELYLLKKQHELLRHNQHQTVPRAHPAHQQPPSLSGQVYQPQPLSFDHPQTLPPGHNDLSHPSMFVPPVPISSSSSIPSSAHMTTAHSSSQARPTKGVHKRSSSLYQCPYCPIVVKLKALEVASHIQQHHPGKQVAFRKIA